MSSARSSNASSKPGSLTNVVQSLVRAQYGLAVREPTNSGASTPNGSKGVASETETDLDRHVAELLMKEAKEREERAKKENVGYWRLSDDEGDQQYQSKTNKRFLKTIIQNVEEHNKPLIRPAGTSRKEELDAIRARDRAERERRTGIRDAERSHRRNGQDSIDSQSESGSRTKAAPGFAARSLAIGLSGARDAKKEEDRKRKELDIAVTKARERASKIESPERADKGKGRAIDQDEEDVEFQSKRSSSSRLRTREGRERSRPSLDEEDLERPHRSHRESSSRRERDRSRERSARHSKRRRYSSEDRQRERRSATPDMRRHESGSKTSREDSVDRTSRSRTQEEERSSHRRERDDAQRKRQRTPDRRSETESEADSSDTFVDTTEAGPSAAAGSKMDKYFTTTYNPALDVSFDDLTDPSTGLIGEGNFSEWDKMLHVLKKRKEDKVFGVTRAREEERDRQLYKLEKKKRKEEREIRRALRKDKKRKKKRTHSDDSESSDTSVGPKMRSEAPKEADTIRVGEYEYGKKGTVRAWDMGKDATY